MGVVNIDKRAVNIDKKVSLACKFDLSASQELNPEFTKVKIYVLAAGENRNGSDIEKYAVKKALWSIKNIPIIGLFDEKEGRFTKHSANAVPYGLIPESTEIAWETVTDDGVETDYLVCTGILWSELYPQVNSFLESESGSSPMSMEITVNEYEEREDGVIEITDFTFSALTVLGVEPCFRNAKIEVYGLNSFTEQFSLMLEKYKNYEKGKNGMGVKTGKPIGKFELTNGQLIAKLCDIFAEKEYADEWGYACARYIYIDFKDDEVYCYDRKENYAIYGFNFTVSGNDVKIDFESGRKKLVSYVDADEADSGSIGKFSLSEHIGEMVSHILANTDSKKEFQKISDANKKLKEEKAEIMGKYEALHSEVGELQNLRKQDLFSRYEKLVGDEADFVEIKGKSETLTYSETETKLALCYANKVL
ncbi:MAG: hypothetical protein LBR54_01915, partial [Oscillospiraceae bacterium]|nr:hypothetical protein [Oscillospiraceae bacterium]